MLHNFSHKLSQLSIQPHRMWAKSTTVPDLTSDRYPVTRGQFAKIQDTDISYFEKLLTPGQVLTDTNDTQPYLVDFSRTCRGSSSLVLKPKSTEEVSGILKYCNERKLAVCPQSGNTGLVGGSVPVFDEIVVSLTAMNKIEEMNELSGILICQSGCILEQLETEAHDKGLIMPLDLGAKGSCLIGGNVSTNAGGLRLLRYGNLHGSVMGVEAVTATGEVLDLMSNFKKDNTGYHLKHMFIGSEGTLGIITRLAMFLPPAPKSITVAFLGLQCYDDVLKTFLSAKRELGEILSACEMIDAASLDCVTSVFNLQSPIAKYPFYMLIETSGSRSDHDEEKMSQFLENAMNRGTVLDGTVTTEPGKINQIWHLRESIGASLSHGGEYCFKYDISLPLSHFYEIVPATLERVGDLANMVAGCGHIGDSNLHLNVSCDNFTQEIYSLLEPFVYEYTSKLKGSVSAEHGVGFLKPKYLKYSKSPGAIEMMKMLKKLMDPNGILNPYKVLPSS